eukprot:scaffold29196_cov94-Skeletonema_dohrnii-CCMP3373.AAC.1
MANYNGSSEAVERHSHSVRYDMVLENRCVFPNWASSGHLRRCSDADIPRQCLSREKDGSADLNHCCLVRGYLAERSLVAVPACVSLWQQKKSRALVAYSLIANR